MVEDTHRSRSILLRIALTSVLLVASVVQVSSPCRNPNKRRIHYCTLATFLCCLFLGIYALLDIPWRIFIVFLSCCGAILSYSWTVVIIQVAVGLSKKSGLPSQLADLRVSRLKRLLWIPCSVFMVIFAGLTLAIVLTDQNFYGGLHALSLGIISAHTTSIGVWYFHRVRRMVDLSIEDFLKAPELLGESVKKLRKLRRRLIKLLVVCGIGGYLLSILGTAGGILTIISPRYEMFSEYYDEAYASDDFTLQELYVLAPIFFGTMLMYHSWVKPRRLYRILRGICAWFMVRGPCEFDEASMISKESSGFRRPTNGSQIYPKNSYERKSSTSFAFRSKVLHTPMSRQVLNATDSGTVPGSPLPAKAEISGIRV
ncbi:hypothetical protein AAMO2058_000003400 [Amorphochlora amoebiformis]